MDEKPSYLSQKFIKFMKIGGLYLDLASISLIFFDLLGR